MSALALVAIALSWLGRTLIITTVASSPMMTITTISSTRVKPSSPRRFERGRLREKSKNSEKSRKRMGSASDQALQLQDGEKNGEDDGRDDSTHDDDDHGFQHRQRRRGEIVELAFEIVGRARQHGIQPPGAFAAGRQIDHQLWKHPSPRHRAG